MRVEVLSFSNNALETVYTAIRTCKSFYSPMHIRDSVGAKPYDDVMRLLKACAKAGHLSVFEHVSFSFGVEGVSRSLLAQITRHRIGISFSVQSQRYVGMDSEEGGFSAIVPESISSDEGRRVEFEYAMGVCQRVYDSLKDSGVPSEDARFVLPNAASTNFVISFNLRSFMDFYTKRVKVKGAQWEIRELAEEMREKLSEKMPWIDELMGGRHE